MTVKKKEPQKKSQHKKKKRGIVKTGIMEAEDTRAGPNERSPTLVGHSAPEKDVRLYDSSDRPGLRFGPKAHGSKRHYEHFPGHQLKEGASWVEALEVKRPVLS